MTNPVQAGSLDAVVLELRRASEEFSQSDLERSLAMATKKKAAKKAAKKPAKKAAKKKK